MNYKCIGVFAKVPDAREVAIQWAAKEIPDTGSLYFSLLIDADAFSYIQLCNSLKQEILEE